MLKMAFETWLFLIGTTIIFKKDDELFMGRVTFVCPQYIKVDARKLGMEESDSNPVKVHGIYVKDANNILELYSYGKWVSSGFVGKKFDPEILKKGSFITYRKNGTVFAGRIVKTGYLYLYCKIYDPISQKMIEDELAVDSCQILHLWRNDDDQ